MKKKAVTGISLVLLLLSLISFQLLIPSANAVEYDLGYGAASVLYGSRWQQTETNNNLMNYAFWEISDLFADLYTYARALNVL
jgi:hypothetical protein